MFLPNKIVFGTRFCIQDTVSHIDCGFQKPFLKQDVALLILAKHTILNCRVRFPKWVLTGRVSCLWCFWITMSAHFIFPSNKNYARRLAPGVQIWFRPRLHHSIISKTKHRVRSGSTRGTHGPVWGATGSGPSGLGSSPPEVAEAVHMVSGKSVIPISNHHFQYLFDSRGR